MKCGTRGVFNGRPGLCGPLMAAVGLLSCIHDAAAAPVRLRRFAFIVGANDGGSGRVRLRYAHSDAGAMARVLHQLGGLMPEDTVILVNPTLAGFRAGLDAMRARVQRAQREGLRIEFLFYYSGHSDERGLLLRGERFMYRGLRRALSGFPAAVRVAVLDSCASGALTLAKGGIRRPPFMVDVSTNVRGYAYLTSTSANENAQESQKVRGSFFTHYLISGLRGAADVNRDGRVTLTEAYTYAFHQTLARTESTRTGPQHPNYAMHLAGSGDLVLTDLRANAAQLVLEPALRGRLFIRDGKGRLVAEIVKKSPRSMVVGLEPGRYTVTLEWKARVRRGSVVVTRNMKTVLRFSALTGPLDAEPTVGRGPGGPEPLKKTKPAEKASRPFFVSAGPGFHYGYVGRWPGDRSVTKPRVAGFGLGTVGGSLQAGYFVRPRMLVSLAANLGYIRSDLAEKATIGWQILGRFHYVAAQTADLSTFRFFLGGEVGAGDVYHSLELDGKRDTFRSGPGLIAGALVGFWAGTAKVGFYFELDSQIVFDFTKEIAVVEVPGGTMEVRHSAQHTFTLSIAAGLYLRL